MERLPWRGAFVAALTVHLALGVSFVVEPAARPLTVDAAGDDSVTVGLAASGSANIEAEPATPPSPDKPPAKPPADKAAPTGSQAAAAPRPIAAPPVPPTPPAADAAVPPARSRPAPPTPASPAAPRAPNRESKPQSPAAATRPARAQPQPPAQPPAADDESPVPAARRTTTAAATAAATPAPAPATVPAAGKGQRTTAAGNGHGDPGAARDYYRELMAWLARHKAYPARAKKAKHQGVVTLEFSVDRAGRVVSARVRQSSGHAALDQAALDMLERANPVPPIPDALAVKRLSLAIPIEFSLITK